MIIYLSTEPGTLEISSSRCLNGVDPCVVLKSISNTYRDDDGNDIVVCAIDIVLKLIEHTTDKPIENIAATNIINDVAMIAA